MKMKYQTLHPAILVEIAFPAATHGEHVKYIKEVELTATISYTGNGEGNIDCIGWDNTIYTKEENKVIDAYVLNKGVNLEDRFIVQIDLESY